jgi:predicted NBD/HSP70 family sugar kinase
MYLLFDIGGTNTRLSFSEDGTTFMKPAIFDTPQSFEDGVKMIEEIFKDFAQGHTIKAIAGGVAGPLDSRKTKLVNAPHLPQWVNKPLKTLLQRIFEVPVFLENDTALVGLGEATHGAGREKKIVAYISVSTGVGGVRIVDEKIDVNSMGFEPGHQIIHFGDLMKPKGSYGSGPLESYLSGAYLEKKYGVPAHVITDSTVWDKSAVYLAYGLHNIIVHWSPDVVVLGGALMKQIDIKKVEEHLKSICTIFPQLPEIRIASLGKVGGLHGALELLKGD